MADPGSRTGLQRLLEPESIAVVGASPRNPAARQALANLLEVGYRGRLFAVNPHYEEVLGVPCFASVQALRDPPDAVLVMLGRDDVLGVVESCASIGVGGMVVVAGGFAESGPSGVELQEQLSTIASAAGMALIGPNCQGLINFAIPYALYLRKVAACTAGDIAVVSQSGSVATAIVNSNVGLRFRQVISSGNESVTTSGDLVGYFAEDPAIRVILMFQENIREPKRFFEQCDRATAKGKTVVMLKSGRTEAARQAGLSHSGALSPPDRLVDALVNRHGLIRVDSLEELLVTGLAATGRRAAVPGLAAVTISGGHIALLQEHAAEAGVGFAALSEATTTKLRETMPVSLRPANPLDAWGLDNPEVDYRRCVHALAEDPAVGTIIVMAEPRQIPTGYPEAHQMYFEVARELAQSTPKVVVLLASVQGSIEPGFVQAMAADGVLVLSGLPTALRALAHLSPRPPRQPARFSMPRVDLIGVEAELDRAAARPFSGYAALQLLTLIGIPTAATAVVENPTQAVEAAARLGLPVAVKSGAPGVLHKLELGAVALRLADSNAVAAAAARIQLAAPGPLLVQSMVDGGAELIVGIVSDEHLGPFVMVGAGGSWAELVGDVVTRAAPLRPGEAYEMVSGLRMFQTLAGARGVAPLDVDALCDAIDRLGVVAAALGPRLASLDVNPLLVKADGVVAVDAAVVPASAAGSALDR